MLAAVAVLWLWLSTNQAEQILWLAGNEIEIDAEDAGCCVGTRLPVFYMYDMLMRRLCIGRRCVGCVSLSDLWKGRRQAGT